MDWQPIRAKEPESLPFEPDYGRNEIVGGVIIRITFAPKPPAEWLEQFKANQALVNYQEKLARDGGSFDLVVPDQEAVKVIEMALEKIERVNEAYEATVLPEQERQAHALQERNASAERVQRAIDEMGNDWAQ
jgi:hypothetical protein